MADDKKLEFKVGVDDVSMARAKTSIDQLLASTKALSEAFKGVGGGGFGSVSSTSTTLPGVVAVTGTGANAGGGGGFSTFTATVSKQADTIKSLTESSKDAMRQMTDAVRNAAQQQNQALLQVQQTANATSAALRGAGAGAGAGSWSGTGAGVYAGTGGPPGGGLPPPPPAPPGGGDKWWQYSGTGFGQAAQSIKSIPGFGVIRNLGPAYILQKLLRQGAVDYIEQGQGIFDPTGSGYGTVGVGVGTKVIESEANRGRFTQGLMNRMLKGDSSDLLAMAMMDPGQQAAFETAGGGWAKTMKWAGAIASNPFSLLTPGVTAQNIDTALAQDQQRTLQNIKDSPGNYGTMMAYDFMGQQYRAMGNYERITGAKSLGLGPKYGYQALHKWAARENVSEAQALSNLVSLRGMAGGSVGLETAKWSTLAQAQGFNINPLVAASLRAEGPGVGSFLGNNIATQAGLNLGQQILGTGFDPMGQTGGAGVLAAFQGGFTTTGKAQDFNQVQRFGLGMNALNDITTGAKDPYQKSLNTLIAAQIVGKAGPGAIDLLARMPAKQLLDIVRNPNKNTEALKYFKDSGVSQEAMKQYLTRSFTSRFQNTFIGAGDSAASAAGRRFLESGSDDIFGYMKTLKKDERGAFSAAMGQAFGLAPGEALGLGGVTYGAGRGQALKRGGVGGGIVSKTLKQAFGRDETMLDKQYAELEAKQEVIGSVFEATGKAFDAIKTPAENFNLAVTSITEVLKESARELMGDATGSVGGRVRQDSSSRYVEEMRRRVEEKRRQLERLDRRGP